MIKVHLFKTGAVLLGLLAAGVLGACDKVYEARLSVMVPASSSQTAKSVASALLSDLKSRFALRCGPPETWTAPASSAEPPEVRHECTERKRYTRMAVITSGQAISVDIHKIGGADEPETFRALRLAVQQYLEQALPGATVAVEFPVEPR